VGIVEPPRSAADGFGGASAEERELCGRIFVAGTALTIWWIRCIGKMLRKSTENVVVVRESGLRTPIGLRGPNDILQLRRWLMEEETLEKSSRQPAAG